MNMKNSLHIYSVIFHLMFFQSSYLKHGEHRDLFCSRISVSQIRTVCLVAGWWNELIVNVLYLFLKMFNRQTS